MNEAVRFLEEGGTLKAKLLSEIDHHAARSIREEIDAMLFRCRPDVLELDFSAVRFMDSSGIALIIGRAELAANLGFDVKLTGLSGTLLRLIRLSGVEKLTNLTIQ